VKYELKSKDSGKPAVKVSKIAFNQKAAELTVDYSNIRESVFGDELKRRASESAEIAAAKDIIVRGRDNEPPLPVSGFAAAAGVGRVDLTWKANGESDLAGYEIIRTDRVKNSRKLISADPGKTSCNDAAAECGETYDYSITALDASGNRSASRMVSAVPEFDYYYFGIDHGGADLAVRLNMNNLEFDVMKDAKAVFSGALIAPPDLTGRTRFIFSFNSGFYNVFCHDGTSGDVYYTKSNDLRSFSAWKLLFPGFEVPDGVSRGNSVHIIGDRDDKKFTVLCYDPESEILWASEITRGSPRLAWKKAAKNVAAAPGGTSLMISAGMKDGKYIFYSADPSAGAVYKTVTADMKSWTAWKKAVSFK